MWSFSCLFISIGCFPFFPTLSYSVCLEELVSVNSHSLFRFVSREIVLAEYLQRSVADDNQLTTVPPALYSGSVIIAYVMIDVLLLIAFGCVAV